MVRFTEPRNSEREYRSDASDDRRPSPPPNYLRRSNQWRLLVLVASLMLVLVLIDEARKPKYYRWMWGQTLESPSQPVVSPRAFILTREAPESQITLPIGAGDAWNYAVEQLNQEELAGLRRLLRRIRNREALSNEHVPASASAVSRLENSWITYLEHARNTVALPAPATKDSESSSQRKSAHDGEVSSPASSASNSASSPKSLLEKLQQYWEQDGRPALRRLAVQVEQPSVYHSDQRRGLSPLQRAVDDEALTRVRDNTRFGSAESETWFRLIERLREGDVRPVDSATDYVTYLQILDQPDVYRGRWVRVRGEVRRGYRVDAPENDSGVEHYYVLWLKPDDGTNTPITLYALSLPPGFPPLADRSATGAMTELNEAIDAGGAFFKRWAYRGEQSLEIAPVVIASEVAWYPELAETAIPVSKNDVLTALLGGVLLGLGGLWFAWRTLTKGSSKPQLSRRGGQGARKGRARDTFQRGKTFLLIGSLYGISSLVGVAESRGTQIVVGDSNQANPLREASELPWTRPGRPSGASELPDILHLYGLISSDLETLVAEGTSPDQRERLLLNLLYHLPRLTPADWSRWRPREPSTSDLAEEASKHRGKAITLRGRVTEVLAIPVPRELAETLEFSQYWQVSVRLVNNEGEAWGRAQVFARRVPEAWHRGGMEVLDELAEVSGAFLDASRDSEGQVLLVTAAARLSWYPDRISEESGMAGTAIHPVTLELATAGVDHALWDEVRRRNGHPLEGPDRELFYQLLAAMGKRDSVTMGEQLGQPLDLGALLLDPSRFQGQLLTLTAFARRITRVVVEDADIRQRFGIEHYFHIDALITLENQQIRLESRTPGRSAVYADKFPMTLCVTKIPADLVEHVEPDAGVRSARPLINERIEISGIFLKTWPFRSEFLLSVDPEQRHPSPLLLGTRPVRAPLPPIPRDTPLELLLATLFVLILLGGSMWVWKREASGRRRARNKGT